MGTTDPTTGIYFPDTTDVLFPAANWAASFLNTINSWFKDRMRKNYQWANAAARTTQAGMVQGSLGYQADTDVTYRYDGTNWRIWSKPRASYPNPLSNFTGSVAPVVSAFFQVTEGRCTVEVTARLGATGTVTIGGITVTVPSGFPIDMTGVNADSTIMDSSAAYEDVSSALYFAGPCRIIDSATIRPLRPVQPGTYTAASTGALAAVTSAAPMTWQVGDGFSMSASYAVA